MRLNLFPLTRSEATPEALAEVQDHLTQSVSAIDLSNISSPHHGVELVDKVLVTGVLLELIEQVLGAWEVMASKGHDDFLVFLDQYLTHIGIEEAPSDPLNRSTSTISNLRSDIRQATIRDTHRTVRGAIRQRERRQSKTL